MESFSKQPSEVLDYDIDLTEWIAEGDSVTGTTVSADDGLTVTASNTTTTIPKVWCSGGTAGTSYKVTVLITTADGRTKEVDFRLQVRAE